MIVIGLYMQEQMKNREYQLQISQSILQVASLKGQVQLYFQPQLIRNLIPLQRRIHQLLLVLEQSLNAFICNFVLVREEDSQMLEVFGYGMEFFVVEAGLVQVQGLQFWQFFAYNFKEVVGIAGAEVQGLQVWQCGKQHPVASFRKPAVPYLQFSQFFHFQYCRIAVQKILVRELEHGEVNRPSRSAERYALHQNQLRINLLLVLGRQPSIEILLAFPTFQGTLLSELGLTVRYYLDKSANELSIEAIFDDPFPVLFEFMNLTEELLEFWKSDVGVGWLIKQADELDNFLLGQHEPENGRLDIVQGAGVLQEVPEVQFVNHQKQIDNIGLQILICGLFQNFEAFSNFMFYFYDAGLVAGLCFQQSVELWEGHLFVVGVFKARVFATNETLDLNFFHRNLTFSFKLLIIRSARIPNLNCSFSGPFLHRISTLPLVLILSPFLLSYPLLICFDIFNGT